MAETRSRKTIPAIRRWISTGRNEATRRTHPRRTRIRRLARKSGGHEARLAYCGNVMIENRHGLVVDAELMQCSGTAERDAAMRMAERLEGTQRVTVGADKGYDTKEFVREMRGMKVTPHVAQNHKRNGGSAIDQRTTRHAGYQISQQRRKRIESNRLAHASFVLLSFIKRPHLISMKGRLFLSSCQS